MKPTLLCAVFGMALLSPLSADAVEVVTTCGQTVEGAAVLAADLDCTAAVDRRITLIDGTLDLAGHTLAADVYCDERPALDQRTGDCVILGPGIVTGCVKGYRVQVLGVNLSFDEDLCDEVGGSRAGVFGGRSTTVIDSVVSGYPNGGVTSYQTYTKVMILRSSVAEGSNGPAVAGDRVKIQESIIDGSIIAGTRASLRDTQVNGVPSVYEGLDMREDGNTVKLIRSSITGMTRSGITGEILKLKSSDVSGNCTGGGPGCADLVVETSVKVSNTTCGTSYCEATMQSCGVCTND